MLNWKRCGSGHDLF